MNCTLRSGDKRKESESRRNVLGRQGGVRRGVVIDRGAKIVLKLTLVSGCDLEPRGVPRKGTASVYTIDTMAEVRKNTIAN